MIRWDTCRREFEPDGALRDIYVHGTTIEHWRTLFDALRATYALEYSVDGTARSLPNRRVDSVRELRWSLPGLNRPRGAAYNRPALPG